ncbi:MAG: hypothetical protein AB7K64_12450 [Variibacter sp.]
MSDRPLTADKCHAITQLLYTALSVGANALALVDQREPGGVIEKMIAPYDRVTALFPWAESPLGFGAVPVKGYGPIPDDKTTLRCNVLPMPDLRSALALQDKFGDPNWSADLRETLNAAPLRH